MLCSPLRPNPAPIPTALPCPGATCPLLQGTGCNTSVPSPAHPGSGCAGSWGQCWKADLRPCRSWAGRALHLVLASPCSQTCVSHRDQGTGQPPPQLLGDLGLISGAIEQQTHIPNTVPLSGHQPSPGEGRSPELVSHSLVPELCSYFSVLCEIPCTPAHGSTSLHSSAQLTLVLLLLQIQHSSLALVTPI